MQADSSIVCAMHDRFESIINHNLIRT